MNRRRLSAGELFIGQNTSEDPDGIDQIRPEQGRAVLVTAAGAVPERGKNIHDGHMGAENTICAVITVVYRVSYIQEVLAFLVLFFLFFCFLVLLILEGGVGGGGGGGWGVEGA